MNKKSKPVSIIVFGATGNLAVTKIFPALGNLHKHKDLPNGSRVVAVSRREWKDISFRNFIRESTGEKSLLLDKIFHSEVEFDEGRGYYDLLKKLVSLDKEHGKTDWVFYLSLAPKFYERVIKDMEKSKLLARSTTKLLIEKPFGTDEASARKLNKTLMSFLGHEQVYRVDHYLGKGAVRTLMKMHEKSVFLSKLINKGDLSSVNIKLLEKKGIEKRGASYDGVGAFRDVGQNHILEMLAVLLTKPPAKDKATAWHDARAKVLEDLLPPAKTCELSRRGQYRGYIKEYAIPDSSVTETAFEVITSMAKGALKGVPITLVAGKMMSESAVSIEAEFGERKGGIKKLLISVQPKTSISLCYDNRVEKIKISDDRDAYENIILDAITGQRKHFVGSREILASWRYADRVVGCWKKVPLEIYSKSKPFIK